MVTRTHDVFCSNAQFGHLNDAQLVRIARGLGLNVRGLVIHPSGRTVRAAYVVA